MKDLNKIKEGDVLVDGGGYKQTVLGRAGRVIWVTLTSYGEEPGMIFIYTIGQIIKDGWKFWEEEKEWPSSYNQYYFIENDCSIDSSNWGNDLVDNHRRDFLGIFKTEKEAQARADKIREFVKSLNP